MSCCLPEGVDCKEKIPSKVNFDRHCQNRIAGAVFLAAVLIQYVLAILTLANVEDPLLCFGANIGFSDVDYSAGFGAAMQKHIGAFLMAILLALLLGFVWIYSLQRCSMVVVWGTLITEMVLALAAAIAAFAVPGGGLVGLGITILVFDGIALLIIFIKKKAVDNAAFMLQSAAYCIQYNCSMVLVALGLLLCVVAYSVVPLAGMAASFVAGHWYSPTGCVPSASTPVCACLLSQPTWINGARVFNNLILVWVFFFFNMMRTYVVGATAALWYWHPDSTGRPFTALKWACSSGFGTLSLGGLVVTIIDRINQWASSKLTACCCLCCNPLYLIMYIVMMIYKEIINSLAKFCVIISSITGEDFFVCVGRSYYTLKGKFTTLFVIDGVAKIVMYSAAAVFSCVLWAFAWFVAAGISGENTIGFQDDLWARGLLWQIVLVLLWIFAGVLVYYPLVGIIVCVLWGSVVFGVLFGTSFLIGVFAGALANYLFTFFADVVLDVTTAMFTIVRIDHLNGIKIKGDLSAGSPASVGAYYYKLSGDDTGTELVTPAAAVAAPQGGMQVQVVVQQQSMVAQPVQYGGQPMMAQPMMAQPYNGQPMMAQPMMAQPYNGQPMMAQPYNGQPMMAQPMMAQPYGQTTMAQPMYAQPAYGQQPPGYNNASSDPYDASKPAAG
jgi:hypothetical protein